ncbi:endonuclease MutS2 [Mesoterricola silvestris]|uniref:Endonuclease MutS2 n=1 Tax=Mesoterricola silvestris TaxID=2927979 RepID=A0AA48GMH0_9BACT|nr:Smr/MutS family protein [Mesoterricola silvestris]BDU72220.1 endonuclease MutS2 [Mesoterricola silvestris]
MTKPPLASELQAVEFPTLAALVAGGARTRLGRAGLQALHPWDGLCGLRRLKQMELGPAWSLDPGSLPIVPFDEALDEVINPAGWPLPEHWRQLREGLRSLATLLRTVRGLEWPGDQPGPEGTELGIDRLQVTADLLPDPGPVADQLGRSFTEDGQLDPMRVPGLADLHRARSRCYQAISNRLQRILRDFPDAFQEFNVVERNGRFCLPVRTERRGMVPGLVLDRSSSGATVFVEPFEAVSLNNDHVEADREYMQAVQAFLRDLLEGLRARRFDFERWHRFQADADEALALLRWGALCDGVLPDLGRDRLHLQEARHPLLLPNVRAALDLDPLDHEAVPLTLELDRERPGVVISGSNTGGKTVVLKTVGLLTALARSGCAIPARPGTEVPEMATLHADIGDHQTLIGSLSTFSSHILHLKRIVGQARSGGLVLLDELGTGTDPKEGAALGIALLQALSRRQCWVLCSTHLGEISQWALRHPRFQNASVQFDEERLAPTYRLMVGMPGQSRALTIAAKLGLPRSILDHAEKVLGRREQDWREFLRQLEADRLRLADETQALREAAAAVEKDRRILAGREEALRLSQEKFQRESAEKVQRVLDFIDHESKRLVKELKEKHRATEPFNADRVGTEARERVKTMEHIARAELRAGAAPPRPQDAPQLREGGYARHRGLGVEGRIASLKGDRVMLETPQGRRMETRAGELEPIHRGALGSESPRRGSVRFRGGAEDIQSEINLIGRASDDVDTEIHRFVEASLAAGQKFIRVVHGHGTGRLKAAVREALKGHPGIAKVEDAPQAQGGAGATVITLR